MIPIFFVELNSDPDFNPYFSGWNRSNIAASSGVSIHHPSGDIMKISLIQTHFRQQVVLDLETITTTHWRVFWSETPNGRGVTKEDLQVHPFLTKMDY